MRGRKRCVGVPALSNAPVWGREELEEREHREDIAKLTTGIPKDAPMETRGI